MGASRKSGRRGDPRVAVVLGSSSDLPVIEGAQLVGLAMRGRDLDHVLDAEPIQQGLRPFDDGQVGTAAQDHGHAGVPPASGLA